MNIGLRVVTAFVCCLPALAGAQDLTITNARILDATAKKLGLPEAKIVITVDEHANTSAASVPLAFDTAVKDGRIKRGDVVVLEAMGGGFTWGAAALRY